MPELLTINTQALGTCTEEQFFQFCMQNRDLVVERDSKGKIFIMSPTFSLTGSYNAKILAELVYWNKQTRLGEVFDSSTGFTLPNTAMRSPDVAWIEKKRWDAVSDEDKEKFSHICPDFVIEIKSKSNSLKELKQKIQEWIKNGCRLAWLIDVNEEKVHIYKPNTTIKLVSFNGNLSGENVLPGFAMNLNDVLY